MVLAPTINGSPVPHSGKPQDTLQMTRIQGYPRLVRESRNGFKIKVITTQQGAEWMTSADSLLQSKNIMVFTTCSVGSAQWPKWYSLLHVVPPLLGNEAIHV